MKKSNKWLIGIIILVVVIVLIRAFAPGFILRQLNSSLATISPQYSAHIQDLDLAIWRMAYGFEGITVRQKNPDRVFLTVQDVGVSLAWRELLKFQIVVDIDVDKADLSFDPELLGLFSDRKDPAALEAQQAQKSLVPFRVERVRLENSSIAFKDIPSLPMDQALKITKILIHAANLVPSAKDPRTDFFAHGEVMNHSPLKLEGHTQLLAEPLKWQTEAEIKNFKLRSTSAMLTRMVPISFNDGTVDAYAIVKGQGSDFEGSVKPFIDNLDFVGDRRDFKGFKHGVIEILSAVAAFVLENRKEKSIATQVDFKMQNDEFKVDVAKAIEKSLRHRFGEPLKPEKIK